MNQCLNFFTPSFANVDGGSCSKIASSFLGTGRMTSKKILKFFTIQFRKPLSWVTVRGKLAVNLKSSGIHEAHHFVKRGFGVCRRMNQSQHNQKLSCSTSRIPYSLSLLDKSMQAIHRKSTRAFTHYEGGTGTAPKSSRDVRLQGSRFRVSMITDGFAQPAGSSMKFAGKMPYTAPMAIISEAGVFDSAIGSTMFFRTVFLLSSVSVTSSSRPSLPSARLCQWFQLHRKKWAVDSKTLDKSLCRNSKDTLSSLLYSIIEQET